jgi:hypothetical protein
MAYSPSSPKYQYRRRLPHLQRADADLFITFCTNGPFVLSPEARDLVLQHCLQENRIRLLVVVIMPNHVHLLLSGLRVRTVGRFRNFTNQKEKAIENYLNGLFNLMPATTYSPTHFRVQYNRPGGA